MDKISTDNTAQILARILSNIENYLDDVGNPKLSQECKDLRLHLNRYPLSAMIVYRLRKISKLHKLSLSDDIPYLKREINELIHLLTNLVSWQCKTCGKIIETEHENQLTLWIKAHEITNNHK